MMGFAVRSALLLLVLPLAGCRPEADKTDIGLTIPAYFEYGSRTSATPDTGLADAGAGRFGLSLFGSAELNRLGDEALTGNFDIATASAKIMEAKALAGESAASLYPSLSGTADASRSRSPGTERKNAPPFSATTANNFDLGLSATYMVDFWGRYRDMAEAGKLSVTASEYDRDTTRLSTVAALANAYFQLLATQDRLRLARQNLAIAEKVLDVIHARVMAGTANALDLATQESLVATSRAAIPPLDISYVQAKTTLALLLGRPPESLHLAGGGLSLLRQPQIAAGVPAQILTRRPDIAAAEARLAAQKANVGAARAAFLPNIDLTGKLGAESLVFRNLFRPDATLASLAAGLTQPIFDGGTLQGQLDDATAVQQELLLAYRKSIVSAFSDVETALATIEAQKRHETLQALAVAAAQRTYDINEKILHEGAVDVTSVLNAQTNLFQVQDVLVQVRQAKFSAYVSLIEALGGGWTMPKDKPSNPVQPKETQL